MHEGAPRSAAASVRACEAGRTLAPSEPTGNVRLDSQSVARRGCQDVRWCEMTAVQEEQRSLSIVVRGSFNPAIFHPAWFAAEGLLRPGDTEQAKVAIIHAEVASFSLGWLDFQATRDRIVAQTAQQSHDEAARDVVVGMLRLLRHTPSHLCGVNHDMLLSFPTREDFDAFGWRLVPKDNWEPPLQRPGVAGLEEQGDRDDGHKGYVRVAVRPLLDGTFRVNVNVNDHFDFGSPESTESTESIVNLLLEEWPTIAARAEKMLTHVKDLAK